MWLRLVMGGFLTVLGLVVFISPCITPLSAIWFRFYAQLSIALVLSGVLLLIMRPKEYAGELKEDKSKKVVGSAHPTCD